MDGVPFMKLSTLREEGRIFGGSDCSTFSKPAIANSGLAGVWSKVGTEMILGVFRGLNQVSTMVKVGIYG